MAFFETRPPYERPLLTGFETVEGLGDLSAETCGACHTEIYAEWQTSVHAQAWVDPQYQAEIGKSGNRWLCLNCHTPLLTQQDQWPSGLVDGDVDQPIVAPNPDFDAELRDEGITCASCHVREGAIAGPGLGGEAPHKVVVDPDLRSGAFCQRCHDVTAMYEGKSFICTFQTGDEWRAGPYDDEGTTCVTCHMPTTERPAAVGGPERTVARHWWRGAGIPKLADGPYPPPEANPFGLEVVLERAGDELVATMTNANAGHLLPTGDPERWVHVQIEVADEGGSSQVVAEHRIEQVWEWSTPPKKVSDNRLKPRESRELRAPIPAGAVKATVQARNCRISEENAAYHHLGDYPRCVDVMAAELELGNPK